MPSKMQQVRVPLPPAQVAELNQYAEQQGISTAEYIRRLLVQSGAISAPGVQHGGDRHKK